MVDGKASLARPAQCNYDAICEEACPTGAIALPYQVVFETPVGSPAREDVGRDGFVEQH
jgi:ferredoxin